MLTEQGEPSLVVLRSQASIREAIRLDAASQRECDDRESEMPPVIVGACHVLFSRSGSTIPDEVEGNEK